MKKIYFYLIICLLPIIANAQTEENKFGIKFSGFVKNDMFFDTRQNFTAREGHFLLWPAAELKDTDGDDINAGLNFNFLSIQSRLTGTITGPDAFGAKTSGMLETDFFGQDNLTNNVVRLRHAFVKLNWTKVELLFGQYWHPMFITDCFPGTVSFNTGTPIQPFSRNPQVRFTMKPVEAFKLIIVAQGQRDYATRLGALGGPSSDYLRNSGVPDMHLQVNVGKIVEGKGVIAGADLGYKTIVPALSIDGHVTKDQKVSSMSILGFLRVDLPAISLKFEGIYGENLNDVLSIGGIATSKVTNGYEKEYTPFRNLQMWTDIQTTGKQFQFGLFAGYVKNLGTKEKEVVAGAYHGWATNMESLLRVSPRIVFNSGKVRFAFELEITQAAFGVNDPTDYAKVIDATAVTNVRSLLAVYYFF